ncbi:hypothetical protein BH11PSE11_BH11PSE11_22110 [soil metagenome]
MVQTFSHEAFKPNAALQPFAVLVGEWTTVGTHPMVPGKTFHGRTTFKWLEGGAFLMMHAEIQEPDIPTGVAIFGSDDSLGECHMLYYDERGVSRKYQVTLQDRIWKWWRHDPEFSQRFTGTLSDDGLIIVSKGELSRDGINWEGDLELTYKRAS